MKKLGITIMILCLSAVLLVSCNGSEQTQGNTPSGAATAVGSFSSADIALIINGKTYHSGDDVKPLLKELGEGYQYSEAISCAYDGLDKIFTYDNFDIYTYPDGDIDRVSEITVYGGNVETPKGLKIGDTVQRLEELYGTDYSEEGLTLVYEIPPKQQNAEGASLYVTVEDNAILSIAITAEMLME